MKRTRLYGIGVGHGSFGRVTQGIRKGLEAHGALAGFVPIDANSDEPKPGYDAEEAIFVGPPPRANVMTYLGWHEKRWVLLPPNSSWVPEPMLRELALVATGLISPSAWGEKVLRGHLDRLGLPLETAVYPHGVDETAFHPDPEAHDVLVDRYDQGHFHVTHLASTTRQRKGTKELIDAWASLVLADKLGKHPVLRMILEASPDSFASDMESACRGSAKAIASYTWSRTRLNMNAEVAAAYYRRHHVVCQPSRGEGFGLCPLESRACGIVTVATRCTGQSHVPLDAESGGVVLVKHGPDAPIDDGPGALAPAVAAADVASSLLYAFEAWKTLAKSAMVLARSVGQNWSWKEVTSRWLEQREAS